MDSLCVHVPLLVLTGSVEMQIIKLMDDHNIRVVQLIIDFSTSFKASVQLENPYSHPVPPNVARDSKLSQKWSILMNEPDTLRRRRVLVCATLPMGKDKKILIGSIADVHKPMTLRLFD